MFYPEEKRKLTVEVKQEKNKFYAIIWQEEIAINQSDYFNTAAGASVAGYLLVNDEQQIKKAPYLFESRNSATI